VFEQPPRLTPTAAKLFRAHTPGRPAYLAGVIGPPTSEADLKPIDGAYAELIVFGLVRAEDGERVAVLPGAARCPFVLTQEGVELKAA
jgi:hypothetical protein